MEQQRSTIEVFCCYGHKDEHLLDELKQRTIEYDAHLSWNVKRPGD